MSDTSLVFNVLARDRASRVFDKIRRNAQQSSAAIVAALGPGLLPVAAAGTAAVVGLGAAMAGAGAAAGVFGAVVGSSFSEIKTASDKTEDLREKIRLLRQQIKVASTTGIGDVKKLNKSLVNANNELIARMQLLPPATREAVFAFDDLKSSWQNFVDANKPATFGILTGGFTLLSGIIPKLQPLFDVAANAAQRLVDSMTKAAGGGGIEKLVSWLSTQAKPAIDNLIVVAKNFGTILANSFSTFAPTGQGVLQWLADVTTKWADWSKQTEGGGLKAFAEYVTKNGPKVVELLTNLATAAMNIAKAVAPLAPVSLAIATALAGIIAAIPPGVLTALVAGWVAYSLALKAYYAYTVIVGAATKVWTGIQWLLNTAMFASPITWIVLGILLLIGVIVLIATKTTWFQTIWKYVWDFMKDVGSWFAGPFADFFVSLWNKIVDGVKGVWNWIKDTFNKVVSFVTGLPGKIRSAASGMWDGIKDAFKGAINWVIGKWNGLRFTIPGFSAFGFNVGGFSLGVPRIPYLNTGGDVLKSGLAVIHEGERVVPAAQARPLRGNGGGVIRLDIHVTGDDSREATRVEQMFREGRIRLQPDWIQA